MSKELEEGDKLSLDFGKLNKIAATNQGVLPVIVQNAKTLEVLILAYANQKALDATLETGVATFWSTSRNELWVKGATSGDALDIAGVRVNCEQNSLLYLVNPRTGAACHTKDSLGKARGTCYYRRINPDGTLSFVPGMK